MDTALMLALIGSFAALVTAHASLCFGLAKRQWWRGLAALVLFPLAPLWGAEQRLRMRVALWLTAFVTYGALLIAALALR